jgi:hypothetical protein
MSLIKGLIDTMVHLEGETASVDFGLDAVQVFNQMMSVIKGNIVPILTLMGLMLGAAWVIKYFKKARKGSI